MIVDFGIYLEIFGFLMLFLSANRNPNAAFIHQEGHKESIVDRFRTKI